MEKKSKMAPSISKEEKLTQQISSTEQEIIMLKDRVSKYKTELRSLKARVKVSKAQ